MYISDEFKVQWWLPPRTGSRMTQSFLLKLDFESKWGHHTCFGDSTYDVYINIRNPYAIAVSYYHLRHRDTPETFEEYVRKYKGEYVNFKNYHLMDYLQALKERKLQPTKIIRQENLLEDLLSIDFIKNNQHRLKPEIAHLEEGSFPWRKYYPKDLKPYNEYYTQELADIIYENRKKFFDFGGYDKDSWKTLS